MNLLRDLLDLAIPVSCAGCGAAGGSPCPECASVLRDCDPSRLTSHSDLTFPVMSAAIYAGPIASMLVAHKERGRTGLATPLGGALSDAVLSCLALAAAPPMRSNARVVLVPIPSSRPAVRRRGHDAVLRTARSAARVLSRSGLDVEVRSVLSHVRPVADQADLGQRDRFVNLDHALVARSAPRRPGYSTDRVVVVDDIVTSGASLADAVRALRVEGHRVVGAATVAAVPALGSC